MKKQQSKNRSKQSASKTKEKTVGRLDCKPCMTLKLRRIFQIYYDAVLHLGCSAQSDSSLTFLHAFFPSLLIREDTETFFNSNDCFIHARIQDLTIRMPEEPWLLRKMRDLDSSILGKPGKYRETNAFCLLLTQAAFRMCIDQSTKQRVVRNLSCLYQNLDEEKKQTMNRCLKELTESLRTPAAVRFAVNMDYDFVRFSPASYEEVCSLLEELLQEGNYELLWVWTCLSSLFGAKVSMLMEQYGKDILKSGTCRLLGTSFPINVSFTGRKDELLDLETALQNHRKFVLWGFGGIGKLQLVRHYAAMHRNSHSELLYSVYEGSLRKMIAKEGALLADFPRLRDQDQAVIESEEEYAERKLNELKALSDSDTLWIIDNYNPHSPDPFLNEVLNGPWQLILITRCNLRYTGLPIVEVRELKKPDQKALFLQTFGLPVPPEEEEWIEQILKLIRGHTFTIVFLARTIRRQRISFEEVYRRLLDKGLRSMEETADGDDYDKFPDALRILFDIDRLSDAQKKILRLASCLPPTGIAADLFLKLAGSSRKDAADLVDFGWLQFCLAEDRISLHPLLRDLIRMEYGSDPECRKEYAEQLIDLCDSNLPYMQILQFKDAFEYLLDQADPAPEERCEVLLTLARICARLGCFQESLWMGKKCIELTEDCLRACPDEWIRNAARAHLGFGITCARMRDGERSITHLEKACRYFDHYASLHPETDLRLERAKYHSYLAMACGSAEDYQKQIAVSLENLKDLDQMKGFPEDVVSLRRAMGYSSLASGCSHLNPPDYDQAIRYSEQACDIFSDLKQRKIEISGMMDNMDMRCAREEIRLAEIHIRRPRNRDFRRAKELLDSAYNTLSSETINYLPFRLKKELTRIQTLRSELS